MILYRYSSKTSLPSLTLSFSLLILSLFFFFLFWKRESFIAEPSKVLVPQNPKLPNGLGEVFNRKYWGCEGCRVCDFFLLPFFSFHLFLFVGG